MSEVPVPVGRSWTTGIVREIERPTDQLVKIRFEVADRTPHRPGQHYVVRLRAPDDYTAQRSYSIASDPDDPLVEIMVEVLPRGEVSPFLHEIAEVGDEFELRGPIGRWFVWNDDVPSICVGGGSGVVPFVSMLRYAQRTGIDPRLRIIASAQTRERLPYVDELEKYGALIALTRENHHDRVAAHIYPDEVKALSFGAQRAYVCGSVGFVSFAGRILADAGIPENNVRVEQFGPSA
jgi:ferredoxin-NADP reductase